MTGVPWTPGLQLHCPACGWTTRPSAVIGSCGRCDGPLETRYPSSAAWCLPIPAADLTDLGRLPSPLLPDPDGAAGLLKLESRNPTGSHKDRFHSVVASIARHAGAPGLVTTSTGNHGVSCAAHAAREGLRSVVFSTAALPRPLEAQIVAYGGIVAMLQPDHQRATLRRLVDAGWVAATSSDPALSGAGSPYGADGYRLVVDEIVDALGRLPDAISVPCASGDTLVGIVRGVEAHARRGGRRALVLACQPDGAATLRASLEAGQPALLPGATSVARSTADEQAGRLAIGCVPGAATPVDVSDQSIVAATVRLAARGLYVETSSALAVAGIDEARRDGLLSGDAIAVAIVTAQGRGWNEDERLVRGAGATCHEVTEVLGAAGLD